MIDHCLPGSQPAQLSMPGSQVWWIHGAEPSSTPEAACWGDLISSLKGQVQVIATSWTGYESYASLRPLLEFIWSIASVEAPELIEQYSLYLESVIPHLTGQKSGKFRRHMPADAVVLAITRRISRESHHSALLIDALARFMLTAQRNCPSLQPGLTFLLQGFEYWDRPSIRILCRLSQLSLSTDYINWVGVLNQKFQSELASQSDLFSRLERTRANFFATVEESIPIHHDYAGEVASFSLPPLQLEQASAMLPDMVAEALTEQNYERVYFLCASALTHDLTAEEVARIWHLIALADANVKFYQESMLALDKALDFTASPATRARIRYLQGLLSTKRFYDLRIAADYYQRCEDELAVADMQDAAVRLEKAWLQNGRALMYTLEAKQATPDQREQLLQKSFQLEIQAYTLIGKERGIAFAYLRYNLLANITFLLEISQRFEAAISFWERAFESNLTVGNPGFELAFQARLGLLMSKAGRYEEAENIIKQVYAKAIQLADPYYQERIGYSLAYLHLQSGDPVQAVDLFLDGFRLSADLRFWGNCVEQLTGAFHCAAQLCNPQLFNQITALLAELPSELEHEISAKLRACAPLQQCPGKADLEKEGICLKPPSPKLPSYIPEIDLEGKPERDLNRLLVSNSTPA